MFFKISVLLVTYNHEKYLNRALDSLFLQILNASVELIIADDSSTDATLDIIKGYEGKDDRFTFKYLDSADNMGITKNYQRGFSACSGQYVAVLEGDDYWISPLKLQRQMDFLDNHYECDLCSVNYLVFEENRSHFYPRVTVGKEHRLISARELIADNIVGNFSTCMYRKTALSLLPKQLFEICSYDWIVNICVARTSLIGFLEEPMSVYRLHSNGVWTQTPHIEKLQLQLKLIPEYDELTNKIFHDEFKTLSNRLEHLVSMTKLVPIAAAITQTTVSRLSQAMGYLPPIVLSFIHAFTPPKFKQLVVKALKRGKV